MSSLTDPIFPHPRDWTPILKGDVYCSPACGHRCKHKDYLACVEKADALAKRLGQGFKPRVTENLGWYYSAESGVCAVHPVWREGGPEMWQVYFNSAKQHLAQDADPVRAVQKAINAVRDTAALLSLDARNVEVALQRPPLLTEGITGDEFDAKLMW